MINNKDETSKLKHKSNSLKCLSLKRWTKDNRRIHDILKEYLTLIFKVKCLLTEVSNQSQEDALYSSKKSVMPRAYTLDMAGTRRSLLVPSEHLI